MAGVSLISELSKIFSHMEFVNGVDVTEGMGIGDKAIFGNQMKFTVGKIFDKITAEDGTVIDATFRTEGFIHRIVTSPDLIGTTSEILDRLGKKAVEMYFGK